MPALISEVLSWVRTGFPDGVPDAEAPALFAVLTERLGTERAQEVLRQLSVDGRLTPQAASSLLADDVQKRQVAAKLVLGGWPLGPAEDAEPEPPQEGGALGRIMAWLREGYPGGVPDHDYIPLLALLERRLTKSEVKQIARSLRRADVSPAGPEDIAAAITEYTLVEPRDADLRRVRNQLAKQGWPVDFPDPDQEPAH